MDAKKLILSKMANDEVLFIGDSENDIREMLSSVFGVSPEEAQVFKHEYDGSKVFFRCVNKKTRPIRFDDEDEVNEFIYNQTTILNAWNIDRLIYMFDNWCFDRLVSFAMKDGRAFVCINGIEDPDCERVMAEICDLADGYGCHDDDDAKSTFEYVSQLIHDRYSYIFRHEDFTLDASTGLGTTSHNPDGLDIVFPLWLFAAKFLEEERKQGVGFDDLF